MSLPIDLPPSRHDEVVHVRFERLSSSATAAEMQKDVLMQFLRSQFPEVDAFVDAGKAARGQDQFLVVSCLLCYPISPDSLILPGTLKGPSGEPSGKSRSPGEATFRIQRGLGITSVWRVKLAWIEAAPLGNATLISPTPATPANPTNATFLSQEAQRFASVTLAERIGEPAAPPPKVKRLEQVKIFYRGVGGLTIETTGRALEGGAQGASIPVEIFSGSNGESALLQKKRKVVRALVTSAGVVEYERK